MTPYSRASLGVEGLCIGTRRYCTKVCYSSCGNPPPYKATFSGIRIPNCVHTRSKSRPSIVLYCNPIAHRAEKYVLYGYREIVRQAEWVGEKSAVDIERGGRREGCVEGREEGVSRKGCRQRTRTGCHQGLRSRCGQGLKRWCCQGTV